MSTRNIEIPDPLFRVEAEGFYPSEQYWRDAERYGAQIFVGETVVFERSYPSGQTYSGYEARDEEDAKDKIVKEFAAVLKESLALTSKLKEFLA